MDQASTRLVIEDKDNVVVGDQNLKLYNYDDFNLYISGFNLARKGIAEVKITIEITEQNEPSIEQPRTTHCCTST